jgi:DNA-binding LytR/AlgR family response regulator
MTTAVIADDEPHLAAYLRTQLAALWPELEVVAMARNGDEAAAAIAAHRPDLAFLDIRMPGLTGLEVAQGIEGATRVVFVTAFDEFALQAFEQETIDYVLKPVSAARLGKTVERVKRALVAAPGSPGAPGARVDPAAPPHTEPDDARLANVLRRLLPAAPPSPERLRYVRASQGDLTHQIDVADVLFFRADEKYTCVQTAGGEHLIRTPIAELAAQLDPQSFWQVHRSTLVNLHFVAGTRRDELSRLFVRVRGFEGELPVSRAYVHLFKAM